MGNNLFERIVRGGGVMLCSCSWLPTPHEPVLSATAAEAFERGWNLVVAVHYFDPADRSRLVIVSRKEDRTKFCVPGGKVDPSDWDSFERIAVNAEDVCRVAAAREAQEEAGLLIEDPDVDLTRVLSTPCFGDGRVNHRFVVQYLAKRAIATMMTSEPIDVRWGRKKDVIVGPFGDVYAMVFEKLEKRSRS